MAFTLHLIVILGLSSGLCMAKRGRKGCNMEDCCKVCPERWTERSGRCYLFNAKEMDWCDAESFCVSNGGNLVSIHKLTEDKVIRDYVFEASGKDTYKVISKGVWLGGTDAVKEKHWKWSDGSQYDKTEVPWSTNEPNNFRNREHCMALSGIGLQRLNDIDCSRKFSVICARDFELK